MPFLFALLGACSWMGPPDTGAEDMAAEIEALRSRIADIEERSTELEAERPVPRADLPAELDAYITHLELDDRLEAYVSRKALDEELKQVPRADDVEDAITAWIESPAFDAEFQDFVQFVDLDEALENRITRADLAAILQQFATSDELAQAVDDMATRAWVERAVVDKLEARIANGYDQVGRKPPSP